MANNTLTTQHIGIYYNLHLGKVSTLQLIDKSNQSVET